MKYFLLPIMILFFSCSANEASKASFTPDWIAFGDSITVGQGASSLDTSFIKQLEPLVGPIENRAKSGSRIDEQYQIINSYSGSARKAIWLLGYNDMRAGTDPATYWLYLDQALNDLTARGFAVYLGLCLKMTSSGYIAYGPAWNHGSDAAVDDLNSLIIQVASRYPAVHIVNTATYDPYTGISGDLIHPNDAGHWQIARAFIQAIQAQSSQIYFFPLIAQR